MSPIPTLSQAVLCCALLASGITQAQSLDASGGMPPLNDSTMTMGAGVAEHGQSARGVFVGTIAALLAHGVGTALAQGLAGSITRWFGGHPGQGALGTTTSDMAVGKRAAPASLQAGVAYEVHLIGSSGTARAVDPARHVFRTGDRFEVHYRPTLPGRIRVSNIDPLGAESHIDDVEVAAGQLATLGPYRFVQAKGRETLKLQLQPCSSPRLSAATRAIVRSDSAASGPALRIGACDDARTRGVGARARTITKTTLDGSTAFALDPLGDDELKSGSLAARELRIVLQHR